MGQPSLVDSLLPGTLGRNERLERIGREIEWDGFDVLVAGVYSAPEGRPIESPASPIEPTPSESPLSHPHSGESRNPSVIPTPSVIPSAVEESKTPIAQPPHVPPTKDVGAHHDAPPIEPLASPAPPPATPAPPNVIPTPSVIPSAVEESKTSISQPTPVTPPNDAEAHPTNPILYAQNLALQKAQSVANADATVPVVGADTIVVAPDGRILNKPKDADEARAMLRTLKEGDHQVITAIAVIPPSNDATPIVDHLVTTGRMRDYTDEEIEEYIATGDPFDKAGAYGIQHPQFRPVAELNGCYLNVVGLPLCLLDRLLRRTGITPRGPGAPAPKNGNCSYCAERTPAGLVLPA